MSTSPPPNNGSRTWLSQKWESTKNSLENNKGQILQGLYLLIGATTILTPVLAHEQLSTCVPGSFWHQEVFHVDSYAWDWAKSGVGELHFRLTRNEVWEMYAIVQAALFSLLLLFEPDDVEIRWVLLTLFVIFFLCPVALILLAAQETQGYQAALLLILVGFSWEDRMMWQNTKQKPYKLMWFYVDLPILFAYCLVTAHVGWPIAKGYESLFSGAVAFQLIVGNAAIFLIRSHSKIDNNLSILRTLRAIVS